MGSKNEMKPTTHENKAEHTHWVGGIFTGIVVPVLILAAGAGVAFYWITHSPSAQRGQSRQQARWVDVIAVERQNHNVTITAMGTVVPARQVEIKPQVSGEIIKVNEHLIPGGVFAEGELMMQIEPLDYELALRQRESELATAQSSFKLELGNQAVARQEFEMLGRDVGAQDEELVLRRPQLLAVQSVLEAAEARLEQARLNLERTKMVAPFNALVQQKFVDVGTMASPTSPVVSLTGTDEYWVEAALPVDGLKWLSIPLGKDETGSSVRIYNPSVWGDDVYREGRILRLSGELEPNGRMAQVLVSVKDPLALTEENAGKPALIIGSYVHAEMQGRVLNDVVKVQRPWLRDGDKVWVVSQKSALSIRPIDVVFRAREYVLAARGLETGELVITTDMAAAVEGMSVRVEGKDATNEKKSR